MPKGSTPPSENIVLGPHAALMTMMTCFMNTVLTLYACNTNTVFPNSWSNLRCSTSFRLECHVALTCVYQQITGATVHTTHVCHGMYTMYDERDESKLSCLKVRKLSATFALRPSKVCVSVYKSSQDSGETSVSRGFISASASFAVALNAAVRRVLPDCTSPPDCRMACYSPCYTVNPEARDVPAVALHHRPIRAICCTRHNDTISTLLYLSRFSLCGDPPLAPSCTKMNCAAPQCPV